eukprot:COSAG01_NODE_21604_length_894_cov_0.852830_2_plen_178_part_01
MGCDEGRSDGERVSAWLAAFTLSLRNAAIAVDAAGTLLVQACENGSVLDAGYSGRLQGKEELAVVAGCMSLGSLMNSFATQLESAAMRALAEKKAMMAAKPVTNMECTDVRCQDYLAQMSELIAHDEDLVLTTGAAFATMWSYICSGGQYFRVLMALPEFIPALLALLRRVGGLGQPA